MPRPAPPAQAPGAARERSWSVGTILLVLGAFGLVVAGLIFVTRSWQDIGLAGRTLILLGVTALIGGLAVWVTRRPLRASAEAVWSVFLALLTLDFFAARHEGLAGLGSLDLAAGWVTWGVVALVLGVALSIWAKRHVAVDLVVPAVAAGLAIAAAGAGAGAVGDDWDIAWRAVVALLVTGLLALGTRPAGSRVMTTIARIVVAAFYVMAYVAALVELVAHPSLDEAARQGHGGPLLLMGLASLAVAWIVPVVRIPAVALAVVAASVLVVTPVLEAGPDEAAWTAATILAVVLAIAAAKGTNDWVRGVRLGATPLVAAVAIIQLKLLSEAVDTLERIGQHPWRARWDVRLDVLAIDDRPLWVVPVVLVGLLVTTWFVMAWPELADVRPWRTAALGAALALGVVTSTVALRLPLGAALATMLLVAAALAVLRLRDVWPVPTPVALALVLVAAGFALPSQGASAVTWLVGGVLLLGVAFVSTGEVMRLVHAAAGTLLLVSGSAAVAALSNADAATVALVVVVVALASMGAVRLAVPQHPVAPAVELVAGVAMVVGLVTPGESGEIAVRWTIAGAGLIALSLVGAGRRWLVWPGMASLVVAYVALIVDSGFSFVEAYTLPLGVAGLAAGVFAATKKPDTSTWALLGPGLAVSLLPSVPQSLAEPTELRALLLGAGALAVLAVGVRLRWQAPFVAGTTIVTLLVLFNIGPYANAAPRVVLIAAVSAVLLGVGITWEDRVRDGRRLVTYVRSMR
jgi:hypothetical protein